MAFQVSPNVLVQERDVSLFVAQVSTTAGAFVGHFNWGPAEEYTTVDSEKTLYNTFGRPDDGNFKYWFTAANFLAYGDNLRVVRSANTAGAKNATSGNTAAIIKNRDDWDLNWDVFATNNPQYGMFAGRYAGTLGNGIRVCMFANAGVGTADAAWTSWEQAAQFDGPPGTSKYVQDRAGANDEMHIVVLDTLGYFTGGIANSVLEKYSHVSKASDAKNDDGSSNYYVNVINQRSEYIYILNHAINANNVSDTSTWGRPAANVTFAEGATNYTATLAGGSVGTPREADLINAYDMFDNVDAVDVSLLMTGAASKTVAKHVVDKIAEDRRDLVAFVSPPMSAVVNNPGMEAADVVSYAWDPVTGFNPSSYVVMDSGWKKQFDKYNNVYRWVPLNGDIAGLCAYTDRTRDPWWSPAGLNRGQIKNVVKMRYNPGKAARDNLYKNGVNPVVSFPGEGTVLYGDKTLQSKPSAFDRINVRRLFIVLEKAIATASKFTLFEFNDEFTRAQFKNLITPYLRDVQGRRGITDFLVVCDNTNNTPQVIDSNQFVGDIYIKPARSINFIQLNFVAVATGVQFSEVVGKF